MYSESSALALDLARTPDAAHIIILPAYAAHRGQRVLDILSTHSDSLYFAASDSTLPAFVSGLAGSLSAQGRMPDTSTDDPVKAARQIGRALTKSTAPLLIVDELDRIEDEADAVAAMLRALAEGLPPAMRLLISARSLDIRPWQSSIQEGRALIIGETDSVMPAALQVFGFGAGRVFSDGRAMNIWDGPLPRSLFFFMIDHPILTRQAIFETFWEEMNQRDATNVFHVTKRKVAERVGYEALIYSGGVYQRAQDLELYYDVEDFLAAIARGQNDPDDASAWEHAVRLYRGPFLYGVRMPWAAERRAQLAANYTEALISLGHIYREKDAERALGYYLRAQREAPLREDVYREAMKLFADQGDRERVIAEYAHLEESLDKMYGITPARRTRELYESLVGTSAN